MCDYEKREMTKEEASLRDEITKLREENAIQGERIKKLNFQLQEMTDKMIKLPGLPIECAMLLINAECEHEENVIQRALGVSEKRWTNQYTVSELRQIAEHLLVYCNHNEVEEGE